MRALPPLCLDPPAERFCDAGRVRRAEDSPSVSIARGTSRMRSVLTMYKAVRRPQRRRQRRIAAAAHREREVRPGGQDPLHVRRDPSDLRKSLRCSGHVREAVRRHHLRSGADGERDLGEIRSERDDAPDLRRYGDRAAEVVAHRGTRRSGAGDRDQDEQHRTAHPGSIATQPLT